MSEANTSLTNDINVVGNNDVGNNDVGKDSFLTVEYLSSLDSPELRRKWSRRITDAIIVGNREYLKDCICAWLLKGDNWAVSKNDLDLIVFDYYFRSMEPMFVHFDVSIRELFTSCFHEPFSSDERFMFPTKTLITFYANYIRDDFVDARDDELIKLFYKIMSSS